MSNVEEEEAVASDLGQPAPPAAPLPKFPRLGRQTSRVRIQHDWSAKAWGGTPERLVQIQNEVEQALERAFDDATNRLQPTEESRDQAEELAQTLRLLVRVIGNDGRMTRTGELSAIFAEADLSDIDELHMANSKGAPACVELSYVRQPKQGSTAVNLKVSGSDRSWVGGTHQLLSSELAKGVPRWAMLRHGGASALLGLFLALGIAGILIAAFADNPNHSIVFALVVAGSLGSLMGGVTIRMVMLRLFPGFDIFAPGTSPAGRRTLGAAFALLSFAVGVAGLVVGLMAL